VSSLSNFAVGVAVARVAGVAALGEYSLAYAAWLIVASVHRSLITDPMAIENDVHQANVALHMRVGLAAELSLGIAAATVFGVAGLVLLRVGQHSFGIAFVTFAPWLPFLLAQDYWRWVAFMTAKPAKALINDTIFDVIQALTFVLLIAAGERSSVVAIVAWGVGATGGALFGLRQFSVRPVLGGGLERLRLRWHLSKWLLAGTSLDSGSSQAGIVVMAAILGAVGVGGYKASYSLVSGPTLVLVQTGGSIGLPEASRALMERGWPGLRRVQRFVTLAGVIGVAPIAALVLVFSKQLLAFIYGHQFAHFFLAADILALSFLVGTFRLGAVLSFKATKQTRLLYRTSLLSLVASIGLTGVLASRFGVDGAATATLGSTVIVTLTQLILHWRRSRPEAQRIFQGPLWTSTLESHAEVLEAELLGEAGVVIPPASNLVGHLLKTHEVANGDDDPASLTAAELELLRQFVHERKLDSQ